MKFFFLFLAFALVFVASVPPTPAPLLACPACAEIFDTLNIITGNKTLNANNFQLNDFTSNLNVSLIV